MNASFKKNERVYSFGAINELLQKGKTFFYPPFKVVYYIRDSSDIGDSVLPYSSILVSVPKRNFKRAVKRNLLKRRIRECYRLNKEMLVLPDGQRISFMLVYNTKEILTYLEIEYAVKKILQKLSKE